PMLRNHHSQIRILEIAYMTGVILLPLTASVKTKIILKNYWNQVEIPLPGSKGVYIIGNPITVKRQTHRKEMNYLLELFEKELKKITELADEYC
ncbi:MAG: hypothetical protein J7L42_00245, partial [Elusimicrobia bacterium]|nr:hypothetical protein [Elusimicrobiota bacterium]